MSNDADLDIVSKPFLMNGEQIPAGTLLFFNGENETTEVYAIDPDTGTILETLDTAFGTDHVVGGAYHAERNTFFLVQDIVPTDTTQRNLIAEIDPSNGNVLNTFRIGDFLPEFDVNYGDIDISPVLGGLYVVSDSQTSIAHFSPGGSFIRTLD